MAKLSKYKINKEKIKENIGKVHNRVTSHYEVRIGNEEKLFDGSKDPYVSLDFTFPSLFIYGVKTTSGIYNYISEYANKHSIKIVSVSNINSEEESNYSYVSVIFEKNQDNNI